MYQESDYLRATVRECIIRSTLFVFHCGHHSHSSIIEPGTEQPNTILDRQACESAFNSERLQAAPGVWLKAKKGHSIRQPIYRAGKVADEKGTCETGSFVVRGVLTSGVVAVETYVVELKEYEAMFDQTTLKMKTQPECLATDRSCNTGSSILIYYVDTKICNMALLKHVEFQQVAGTRFSRRIPWQKENTKVKDIAKNVDLEIGTKVTPTVLMSTNAGDTMRFILKEQEAKCGTTTYSTNYKGVYLSSRKLLGANEKLSAQDIKLELYVNNKIDFLYHHSLSNIKKMYHDLIQNDCILNREILRTKLAMAVTNVDSVTPLLPLNRGEFGRVSGEVMHIYKCKEVTVHLAPKGEADRDQCYNALRVVHQGKLRFVQPITRILLDIAPTPYKCSNALGPMFKREDGKWIKFPERTMSLKPPAFTMMKLHTSTEFKEIEINNGGLYFQSH